LLRDLFHGLNLHTSNLDWGGRPTLHPGLLDSTALVAEFSDRQPKRIIRAKHLKNFLSVIVRFLLASSA